MNYNLQFYYDLLVEYYNEHQDINIPINYKVTTKDVRTFKYILVSIRR